MPEVSLGILTAVCGYPVNEKAKNNLQKNGFARLLQILHTGSSSACADTASIGKMILTCILSKISSTKCFGSSVSILSIAVDVI